MSKVFGIGCLVVAFIGVYAQVVRHSHWDWGTFLQGGWGMLIHHEPIVVVLAVVGIALLIMDFRRRVK